jgi:hypothetical protein
MLFNHIFAVLGLVAAAECQIRTTTIYKKLSPTLAPVAVPPIIPKPVSVPVAPKLAPVPEVPSPFAVPIVPSPIVVAAPPAFPPAFPPAAPHGPPRAWDAETITNNPTSIVYRAQLYGQYGLQSSVVAQAGPGGVGVRYRLEAKGLFGYGPFGEYIVAFNQSLTRDLAFGIYEKSVPVNGNCYDIGRKFDPYQRGESLRCQFADPETCQLGDLSGKYGVLDAVPAVRKQSVIFTS